MSSTVKRESDIRPYPAADPRLGLGGSGARGHQVAIDQIHSPHPFVARNYMIIILILLNLFKYVKHCNYGIACPCVTFPLLCHPA